MRQHLLTVLKFHLILRSWQIGDGKPFEELSKHCRAEDGFFKCNSSNICINRESVKDGRVQCPDGSDHNFEPLNCTDDEVRCRTSERCVLRHTINKAASCQTSETANYPCRPQEFQCNRSRICIPRWMVANGRVDCDSSLLADDSDELEGYQECFKWEFRCHLQTNVKSRCIPREWVMDGYEDCENGRDELSSLDTCHEQTEFRCKSNGKCVPRYRVFDGYLDCTDGSDEKESLPSCFSNKEFQCQDNRRCIPRSWRGNSLVNCKDGSDESPMSKNESCVEGEFRCHNDRRCIPTYLLCDGMDHCGDCSDEIESCDEPRMFRCPNEPSKCIYWGHSCDTFSDCANRADDIKTAPGFKCRRDLASTERYCAIPQWMLHDDFSNCDDDSDLCLRENSTSTCTGCLDGKTVIASRQICDGIIDCQDFSDECLCSQGRESKKVSEFCQKVVYSGGDPDCLIGSLQCDGKCIGASKVCDGIIDCLESGLDEDLCTIKTDITENTKEHNFECDALSPAMATIFRLAGLQTIYNEMVPSNATRCNNITECLTFEDECSERANCSHRLKICDELPSAFETLPTGSYGITKVIQLNLRRCAGTFNFALGKSICNGILECEDGIDERNCSDTRFACDAGTTKWPTGSKKVVSIPMEKRCDAKLPTDCVDQSDEINCTDARHFYCENGKPLFVKRKQVLDGKQDCSDYSDECPKNVFSEGGISSREELIKSSFLQVLVWIMAFFATFGNASVAFIITKKFYEKPRNAMKRNSKVSTANDLMILNLSVADFLMGVALFSIAIRSQLYKGQYCLFDKEWRTSQSCTALGVTIVLSSQCSVFTLVVLTSYRLYGVLFPINSRQMHLRVVFFWLFIVWMFALFIALLPLSVHLSSSMVTMAWISSNPFFQSDTIALGPYQQFAHRILALSSHNISIVEPPTHWYDIEKYLNDNFPNISPQVKGYFGYYSASGVCIPRLYVTSHNDQEHNPMTSAVMTFNFCALMYIIIAYFLIYRRSTVNRVASSAAKKSNKLHKKIAILIATDLACWFPLCFMTFLSMGKIILSPTAYALSAIVFLPINSSLNPIIYTNPFSLLVKPFRKGLNRARARFRSEITDTLAATSIPQTSQM